MLLTRHDQLALDEWLQAADAADADSADGQLRLLEAAHCLTQFFFQWRGSPSWNISARLCSIADKLAEQNSFLTVFSARSLRVLGGAFTPALQEQFQTDIRDIATAWRDRLEFAHNGNDISVLEAAVRRGQALIKTSPAETITQRQQRNLRLGELVYYMKGLLDDEVDMAAMRADFLLRFLPVLDHIARNTNNSVLSCWSISSRIQIATGWVDPTGAASYLINETHRDLVTLAALDPKIALFFIGQCFPDYSAKLFSKFVQERFARTDISVAERCNLSRFMMGLEKTDPECHDVLAAARHHLDSHVVALYAATPSASTRDIVIVAASANPDNRGLQRLCDDIFEGRPPQSGLHNLARPAQPSAPEYG